MSDQQETAKKNNPASISGQEALGKLAALQPGWRVISDHHLEREFKFPDFRQALQFTNRVGELAEEQNHHPDIKLSWGSVTVQIWTHSAGGLTGSDFTLAKAIDQIPSS